MQTCTKKRINKDILSMRNILIPFLCNLQNSNIETMIIIT